MSGPASTPTRSDQGPAADATRPEASTDRCAVPSLARLAGDGGGERVAVALARGTLYTALGLGFRSPTPATLTRLASPDAAGALGDAAAVVDAGLGARAAALASSSAVFEDLAAAYHRLFGHTARGEVPAYETEYGNEALFQQPQELSDLAGFLAAFGLTLRPDVRERVDHVSCECEFLAFLAFKEAFALDRDDASMCAATARASALFLRDHLGRLAPAFARRVARADPGGLYHALAGLLLALVAHDCRRLGVPLGPEGLGLRPEPDSLSMPVGCEQCEVGGGPR